MTKKWEKQPTKTNYKSMSFDRTVPYSLPGNRDLIIPVRHEHSVNTSLHKTESNAVPKWNPTNTKVISINMDALHSNDTLNKSSYQFKGGFLEPSN